MIMGKKMKAGSVSSKEVISNVNGRERELHLHTENNGSQSTK